MADPIQVAQEFHDNLVSRDHSRRAGDVAGSIADVQRQMVLQNIQNSAIASAQEALFCKDLDSVAAMECAAGILFQADLDISRLSAKQD